MRPSSVDTSEPACTNRKMLSTNSSTSWFCTSRKYSAIVSALNATRRRTPISAEQRRHLGTGLHEPEDVVDEQQHVLVLYVAEVLRHRERAQRDAEAHADLGRAASTPRNRLARTGRCCRRTAARPGSVRRGSTPPS